MSPLTSIMTNVYFVRAGKFVKIGISKAFTTRFRALQTASPVALDVVNLVPCGSEAPLAEAFLHLKFKDQRVMGEWFELSEDDVEWCRALSGGRLGFYLHLETGDSITPERILLRALSFLDTVDVVARR